MDAFTAINCVILIVNVLILGMVVKLYTEYSKNEFSKRRDP